MSLIRPSAEALLLDLDGVLRVFDPGVAAAVERRHELPAGALTSVAFSWARLRPVIVGEATHEQWMEFVVDDLAQVAVGRYRAAAAVAEWQGYRGAVVPAVLAFVRELRKGGVPVGIATNATSLLDDDLRELGLADELDLVVNSSAVGAYKPTREFFEEATQALHTPPRRVLFVDDDDRNVRGARAAGLSAYRWNGPADLPYLRAALGH